MTQSDNPADPSRSLAAALAYVQAKFPEVSKGKTAVVQTKAGGSYSYDYADLTDVSRVLLPILGDAGLSFIAKPTLNAAGKFVLAYKLLHISGESECGEYPLKDQGTPQETGGLITYARRYALCSITGVAPEGDDDDGAAASRAGTAQRRPAAAQQRPTRPAQRATPAGPPLPGEQIPPPPEPPGPASGLPAIQRAMHAMFNKLQISDRDARLRVSSRIVNRPLASSSDLTEDEMHTLLDSLGIYEEQGEDGRAQLAALAAPDPEAGK
jgi:ERF superfamily protein